MNALYGYLAADGFEAELETELGEVTERHGRLMLAPARPTHPAWAQNVWLSPQKISITSIKDAAKQLRAMQRNWALYDYAFHRRASLITDNLPHVSAKPLVFGTAAPTSALGSWMLIAEDQMIASPDCSSPFPNGEVVFVEDKVNAPSRAYLKLWDVFTVTGKMPQPGETCIDLGASPGGWSWVLSELGAKVISVDKAPLAPSLQQRSNITYRQGSAFAIEPEKHEPVDWLFSDVICYPERLLTTIRRWMAANKAKNYVCTLKFQGETDHATAQAFAEIPNSRLMHLSHNKHELTWFKWAVD